MVNSSKKNSNKISTITDAVITVITNYPIGHQFYGNQLKDDCIVIVPEFKDSYVDTFLKMARRNVRDYFKSIERNSSLYERVKSNIEILKEKIEREQAEEIKRKQRETVAKNTEQINPPFSQGLFAFFFVFIFGLFFNGESAFGCPLTERFFNISISVSESSNIAFTPIYRVGSYPARSNLLRVASVETGFFEVLIFCDISITVKSIPLLYSKKYTNQVIYVKKSDILTYKQYNCIVVFNKFIKFSKNSFQNLDNPLGRGYYYYMSI